MGTAEFVQTSFTGGEWSKTAQGRFDLPAYRTAMYASLNGLPLEQGAWTRRPGFLLGAQTNAGQPARVVEYAFQENTPYTLEFTNATLRAFAGYSLAMTNDAQAVLAISTATPAVVETTTAYGWSTGAVVMFNTLGTSDPLLLNRQFTITVVDGTHFSLADAMTGAAIVGTALQTFTTGNVTQVQNYATPYIGTTWDALQLIPGDGLNGSDGLAIVLHGQYAPQILSVATNPTPANYATFAIDPAVFEDGPYLNIVSNGAEVTPSAVSGIVDLVLTFATWSPTTAYSNGDYITAGGVSYQSLLDQNIGKPIAVTFTGSSASIAATNSYVAGNEVIFFDTGGTLPVALAAGTVYYVIASGLSSSHFEVSATSGGSAITMAAAGTGTMTVALAPGSNPSYWEVVQPVVAVGPNGFLQTDIGRHIRLSSEPALWNSTTAYTVGESVTYGAQTYWTCLATGNEGMAPGTSTTYWAINPTGATWTWGRITGLLNAIPSAPAGVAYIGTLTANGGVAAAFNGTADQNHTAAASISPGYGGMSIGNVTVGWFAGENFSGCSPASYGIASATVNPSTDFGFLYGDATGSVPVSVTLQLYGSNSAPSAYNNGTLLGETLAASLPKTISDNTAVGTEAVSIISNSSTAYAYVWVALVLTADVIYGDGLSVKPYIGQIQFINAAPTSNNAGVSVEILGPPLLTTNAIRTWQLGVFNGTVGWPTCGTYHEGRLWLSGSVNNRLDASEPNQVWDDVISFSPTEYDGTVTDGNAINYTLNAPSTNTVQWLKPDLQGIIVGTERGEWLMFATTLNAPLSPLNIDAHQVTRMGSAVTSTALPVQTEHTTVFIQRYARKLIEYFTDIFSGKFTAPDLADMASHLSSAANPLVELAYQQNVSPNIWARTGLGNLIGCAYKRDTLMSSQGPTMKGWHRHTLGSGRTVSSLAIGPSPDGTLDTPVIVTTPSATEADQTYHVCFMNRIFEETDALTSASFLDESVSNVTYTVSGSNLVINGLWPFNGYNCDVFAGGLDCGTYAVANGVMTVPLVTANVLLTSSFVSSFSGAMPIVVGFTYTSQGQLLPPHAPQEAGTRLGPALAKTGRIHNVAVKLVNTLGISFGTKFTDSIGGSSTMKALQLKTNGGEGTQLLAANTMFTGTTWAPLTDPYSLSNKICWQITRPFPATITAIGGTQQTQDQ